MLLIVAEQLSIAFLLQHQGQTMHSARTATEAVRILQTVQGIDGVVLDDRIENIKMVQGYIQNKRPDLKVTSWKVAERNSPFKNVAVDTTPLTVPKPGRQSALEPLPEKAETETEDRFIWDARNRREIKQK